eukprot:6091989-Pleurochrysis_carterae.AAC.1
MDIQVNAGARALIAKGVSCEGRVMVSRPPALSPSLQAYATAEVSLKGHTSACEWLLFACIFTKANGSMQVAVNVVLRLSIPTCDPYARVRSDRGAAANLRLDARVRLAQTPRDARQLLALACDDAQAIVDA